MIVLAHLSNGSSVDVTRLAQFEANVAAAEDGQPARDVGEVEDHGDLGPFVPPSCAPLSWNGLAR